MRRYGGAIVVVQWCKKAGAVVQHARAVGALRWYTSVAMFGTHRVTQWYHAEPAVTAGLKFELRAKLVELSLVCNAEVRIVRC